MSGRRRYGPFAAAPVLAPALLLPLAACGGGNDAERQALACPRPGIVSGLESMERHQGDAATPLVYRAALENIGGTCAPDGDDLAITLSVDLVVEPGPAFPGGTVEVPYFVAVTKPSGEVVDRRDLVARVDVPSGARRGGSVENFNQRFVGMGASGAPDYKVLFGFLLPREEAIEQHHAG